MVEDIKCHKDVIGDVWKTEISGLYVNSVVECWRLTHLWTFIVRITRLEGQKEL